MPVRPVKGQILRLRDPAGPGLLERVVRFEGGYLVPRGDGRYVLGATVEERGFEERPTAGGVYELLRAARELVPGVLELQIEEISVGFRPSTPDNTPVIGAGAMEGLVWATGHHRNGILLAPLTAELVAEALVGVARMIYLNGRSSDLPAGETVAGALASSGSPSMRAAWRWQSTARSFPGQRGRALRSPPTPAWRCSPRCREDDGWRWVRPARHLPTRPLPTLRWPLSPTASPPLTLCLPALHAARLRRTTPLRSPGAPCARACCSARAAFPRWS